MTMFVRITGLAQLKKNLETFGENMKKEVRDLVVKTSIRVQSDAIKSIQRGRKSGRVYTRNGVAHQASAPGEAPATDTGALASSIQRIDSGTRAAVGTALEYGPHLEFGTTNMEARPWLFPALEKNREFYERGLKQLGAKAAKGATVTKRKK